jgi:hypothetical protein
MCYDDITEKSAARKDADYGLYEISPYVPAHDHQRGDV